MFLSHYFKFQSPLSNQRGNTVLLALVSAVASAVSVFYLADFIIKQRAQVTKTGNVLAAKFALHSLADYVVFGVRQKYCFNSTLLPDNNCNLAHSASVERLIMSPEQESFVRELISSGKSVGPVNINQISLSRIEIDIPLSSLSSVHPLFKIFDRLNKNEFAAAHVILTRDNRAFLPRAGREVFISMDVYLRKNNETTPAQIGGKIVRLSSVISIHPRELGSFALIVAKDLYLDRGWNENVTAGSAQFHNFKSRDELGKSTGLIFTSPVYVNGDVHLPFAKDSDGGTLAFNKSYTAITFADRLVLGNGWVYANGEKFTPKLGGGLGYQTWADHLLFGGFLKGIENDGGKDVGLDFFAKIEASANPNLDLYKQCTDRNIKQGELRYLRDAKLWGRFYANPGFYTQQKSRTMKLSLIYPGEFNAQEGDFGSPNMSNWANGKFNRSSGQNRNGIMELSLILGDRNIVFKMPKNGTVDIVADALFPELQKKFTDDVQLKSNTLNKAEQEVAVVEKDIKSTKDSIQSLESRIDDLQDDIADLNRDLAAETDPIKQADINSDIGNKQAQLSSTQGQLGAKKTSLSSLEQSLAIKQSAADLAKIEFEKSEKALKDYEYKVQNPPEFTIKTTMDRRDRQNVYLEVSYKNVSSMIDKKGLPIAPSIGVQSYDLTYDKYNSLLNPPNTKLKQYINFTIHDENSPNAYLRVWQNLNDIALNGTEPVPQTEPSNVDLATLDEQCEKLRNAMSSQSFGGAGWDASFAATTRHSWNFAGIDTSVPGQDPVLNELIIDAGNSRLGANPRFLVQSIVGRCVIKSTADFVSGFLSCDELVIEERTTPLRIIGSIITSKTTIHPSAFVSGIRWSTIYHPQATQELRNARILKKTNGGECIGFKEPIWHPIPSIQETADRFSCNAISLRAKANPFQWSSVDPDCGLLPKATNTTCKKRIIRFFVVEHAREAGL